MDRKQEKILELQKEQAELKQKLLKNYEKIRRLQNDK
jgi:hypothetical protein